MGYIEDIRKLVGSRPIILTGSGIIILNESKEVLLQFRKDTNNWGLPGGYMELGETFEDTIRRELKEEMNVQVENLTLYDVLSGPLYYHEYPNGDKVYSVTVLYTANKIVGKIEVDNKEIATVKFFSPNKLPSNITKTTKMILESYIYKEKNNEG
ncbi:NUDIX hydrolase [Crassaminicella profunda]|uniref:NUDIX hydrolase n=1 Tax=Crassaminicella profunda TaxID=1286698 RepID=UPI001CA669C2|nr:NUDIX hydrolase [Crassaminicella profunda]QZY56725.1 NUDIX hydrolase [Crassaminicella profunda]